MSSQLGLFIRGHIKKITDRKPETTDMKLIEIITKKKFHGAIIYISQPSMHRYRKDIKKSVDKRSGGKDWRAKQEIAEFIKKIVGKENKTKPVNDGILANLLTKKFKRDFSTQSVYSWRRKLNIASRHERKA